MRAASRRSAARGESVAGAEDTCVRHNTGVDPRSAMVIPKFLKNVDMSNHSCNLPPSRLRAAYWQAQHFCHLTQGKIDSTTVYAKQTALRPRHCPGCCSVQPGPATK